MYIYQRVIVHNGFSGYKMVHQIVKLACPLVNIQKAIENHKFLMGKSHYLSGHFQ